MNNSIPQCPLCNTKEVFFFTIARDYQNMHNQNEYKAYRCSECSIIFQFPFLGKEIFDEIYPEDYYAHVEDGGIPFLTKLLDDFLHGKNNLYSPLKHSLYPYFLNIKQANKVLDIGCGKGLFLDVLKANGKETYGLEPDRNAVDILKKKGHHATMGDISASAYEDNFFDLITMFQVFEHLENPSEVIREIYRILKPGGTFILETPNIESSLAKNKKFWRALEFPRHLMLHSPKSVEKLLSAGNFQPKIYTRTSPTDIKETFFLKKKIRSLKVKRLYSIILLPYIVSQYFFNARKGSLLIAVAIK